MSLLDRFMELFRKPEFNPGLTPQPDARPDPEDAKAYEHAALVAAEQDKLAFPVQTLKGKKTPSNVKPEDVKWPDPDPAYETWVDVYEGPQGIGYVVNYEFNRGGTIVRKSINYGPETYRERDWEEVVEPVLPS